MAGSLPDVICPKNKWVELYSATGIQLGRSIIAQNKSDPDMSGQSDALVFESQYSPPDGARDGERLAPGERTRALAGSPGVWVMFRWADGRMFVQERTA